MRAEGDLSVHQVTVGFTHSKGEINRNIYGHFAEHIGGVFYDGLRVGEDSPVENIRGFQKALANSFQRINPPVLRWPGGCFAVTCDWRDGIGPRANRPIRANWWYSHDKRTESNPVDAHEFMDFCRLVGAAPYVAANMTSATPLHIRNWIEYCNFPKGSTSLSNEREQNGDADPFDAHYWSIGKENWGGGQITPEDCARESIRYATVCNSLDRENLMFTICDASGHDIEWTRRLMDEWGCWHKDGSDPSNGCNLFEQQSSQRDEVVAALTLANLNMTESQEIQIAGIEGSLAGNGTVTVLSADDPHAHNSFESPTKVAPNSKARAFSAQDTIDLPPASVVSLVVVLASPP